MTETKCITGGLGPEEEEEEEEEAAAAADFFLPFFGSLGAL